MELPESFTKEMLGTFSCNITPKPSGWKCDLFGNGCLIIHPIEGDVPNAWCRFWHRFFLGSVWSKP